MQRKTLNHSKTTKIQQKQQTTWHQKTANKLRQPIVRKNATAPPIVINAKPNGRAFIEKTKNLATKGFYLKYTKDTTQLHVKDPAERELILQWLEITDTPHHTYTSSRDRTHGYVLEGLDEQVEIEEIKNELVQGHKVPVLHVYRMNRTNKPKYLVVTKSEVTLKHLQKSPELYPHNVEKTL